MLSNVVVRWFVHRWTKKKIGKKLLIAELNAGLEETESLGFVAGAAGVKDEAAREPDKTLPGSCHCAHLPGQAGVRVPPWPLRLGGVLGGGAQRDGIAAPGQGAAAGQRCPGQAGGRGAPGEGAHRGGQPQQAGPAVRL